MGIILSLCSSPPHRFPSLQDVIDDVRGGREIKERTNWEKSRGWAGQSFYKLFRCLIDFDESK